MNFGEALIALKAGKTVRRRVWVEQPGVGTNYLGVYLEHNLPGIGPVLLSSVDRPVYHAYAISHSDVLANDWETVE